MRDRLAAESAEERERVPGLQQMRDRLAAESAEEGERPGYSR